VLHFEVNLILYQRQVVDVIGRQYSRRETEERRNRKTWKKKKKEREFQEKLPSETKLKKKHKKKLKVWKKKENKINFQSTSPLNPHNTYL
jgi:chromatin remodeling complex protein RSC6